jgi:hypothetical protein
MKWESKGETRYKNVAHFFSSFVKMPTATAA